jgi:hypothetical protein
MYFVLTHTATLDYVPWAHSEITYSAIATSLPKAEGNAQLQVSESANFSDGELTTEGEHETFEAAMTQLLGMHRPNPSVRILADGWQEACLDQADIQVAVYPAHLEHVEPEDTWRFVECNSDGAAWSIKTEGELLDHAAELYSKGLASGFDLDPGTVLLALRDMSGLKPDAM